MKRFVLREGHGFEWCELPLAFADPRGTVGTTVNSGLADALSPLGHPKFRTIAFMGAAQIDRFGNLNLTMLGSYDEPVQRFPRSGGACDAASLAMASLFSCSTSGGGLLKLAYFTRPGWLSGGMSRWEAGFKRDGSMAPDSGAPDG